MHAPQPHWPVFDPVHGKFGLYPVATNKHDLARGSHDALVAYVQGVILNHAGGGITVDSWFGDHTEVRVKDVQHVFGLTVDGKVGSHTWGAIDYLASS